MNKFSNILKIPKITYHSQQLLKKINEKINQHKNLDEPLSNELKRDDIIYNFFELPQKIIIEPDFKRFDKKKFKKDNVENEEKIKNENKISSDEDIEVNMDLEEFKLNNSSDLIEDNKKHELNNLNNIENLFKLKTVDEIDNNDNFVILTLNILDFYPKNLLDFCMIFCPNCKERYIFIKMFFQK